VFWLTFINDECRRSFKDEVSGDGGGAKKTGGSMITSHNNQMKNDGNEEEARGGKKFKINANGRGGTKWCLIATSVMTEWKKNDWSNQNEKY